MHIASNMVSNMVNNMVSNKDNCKQAELWDSDSSSDDRITKKPIEQQISGSNASKDSSVIGKNINQHPTMWRNVGINMSSIVPLINDNEEGVLQTDSFREYLEQVEGFEDLRSMFICMILDLKERVKGCEHCETCSQVIELVEVNIRMYKKVSKLAHGFANVFMYLVKGNIPDKLNENAIHLLNVVFILLVKNSKFPDVQFIYNKFKAFINVDAFEGLALRLAIQKYKSSDIRIMLHEWGCDHTVKNNRPIIRAFHYQKFGIVRTLIELGSSYKYYLQKELSATEYQTFQKAIDKYLAGQFSNSTEIEKEFQIVSMINDFRHILIEEDAIAAAANNEDGNDDYNPISTDYFIEDFMQYFYETSGLSPNEKNKKKKKKNKNKNKNKQKTKQLQLEPNNSQSLPQLETMSMLEIDSNQYDNMNDETFNLEEDNIISSNAETKDLILLDTYYTDKITAEIPSNQIHIGNWKLSYPMLNNTYWDFWDYHFQNVFYQYSY